MNEAQEGDQLLPGFTAFTLNRIGFIFVLNFQKRDKFVGKEFIYPRGLYYGVMEYESNRSA